MQELLIGSVSSDALLYEHSASANHSKTTVLELLELHGLPVAGIVHLEVLLQLQGVPSQVTSLTLTVLEQSESLDSSDGSDDLRKSLGALFSELLRAPMPPVLSKTGSGR